MYRQGFDHRSNDPYNEYAYDNLGRLTQVEYLSDANDNEVFAMDDLGNRDNVNLRDGTDQDYEIDELTNRYESVAGASLTYDEAGNLTTDQAGYQYEYDYENRIVKITDANDVDIAEFAYDALGRRIKKYDAIAQETTLYYYNDKWQVLEERDGSENFLRYYVYGNYIDEVLQMWDGSNRYYYVHDHLYSPAALVDTGGDVVERYEYDVYGNCHVLDADYSADADGLSDYDNPYLFTGRRVDFLDDGNLALQINRHRYYSQPLGRWYTHDPLGVDPAGGRVNPFNPRPKTSAANNPYVYVGCLPVWGRDPHGLKKWPHDYADCHRIFLKRTENLHQKTIECWKGAGASFGKTWLKCFSGCVVIGGCTGGMGYKYCMALCGGYATIVEGWVASWCQKKVNQEIESAHRAYDYCNCRASGRPLKCCLGPLSSNQGGGNSPRRCRLRGGRQTLPTEAWTSY